ncbi:unnamed protein product [Lactuca virosa]|uniref:F-box domain-containing protein n=1 Tax=Lactuca virosa TaxID=75947 RepID=A0AAU9LNE7_9ASTR|nr:unnamed protein product [Lactuca virosa]
MFRQLISQVQDLVDLHGFPTPPPPPVAPPSYFFHSQPPTTLPPPWPSQLHDDRKSKRTPKEPKRIETCGSKSNETMEEIWRYFPDDLYEAVIARLPIAAFFRFRSVCRNWNSLLTSDGFTSQCSQFRPPQPWFYTITHENVNSGAMYDPVSRKWHHPILPKIPTNTIFFPVASAGGLLCFLDIGHRTFYVCNPLTSSFKELPTRSAKVWQRVAVGMISEKSSGAYKIMWLSSNGEYEVYNSRNDRWQRLGTMPECIKLPLSLNLTLQVVAADGWLYFLRSDPDGIVSFEMDSGVWKEYLIPFPPESRDHALTECGGRIMMVGVVTKGPASCVCVWELQKMTVLWTEVDRMPNVLCLELYGKHVKLSCLGNGGLVMFSLESKMTNRLITYDILKKEWLKVNGCVRKGVWIACGTAFHPSLTAMA